MKVVYGDLLKMAMEGDFDVIVHGCNCFHNMEAGIARSISKQFPEALAADKATEYGSTSKLGSISRASINRGDAAFTIVNAYTQFDWRAGGVSVDYDAIEQCFNAVAEEFGAMRIGYPAIGAGLAGGDWSLIEERISTALAGCDHTFVVFRA